MSPGCFIKTILNDKEEKMKKFMVLTLIVAFLMISLSCTTIAANGPGPAPSSGDGVSEGSGFAEGVPQSENASESGPGPAPSSGDGVSEGSGF